MVIQWSFDRYRIPRVLRSENPKLKLAAKTEGSDFWLPAGAAFSGRSLGKSLAPYSLVFCHKKQESLSWDGSDRIKAESSKLKRSFRPLSAFSF